MQRIIKIKCVIFCVMMLLLAVMTESCNRTSEDTEEFSKVEEVLQEDSVGEERADIGTDSGRVSDSGNESSGISENSAVIYVDVRGQVNAPGVYEFPEGSRVFEAIEKAGGMTEDASETFLNQAEKLSDGQQIYVPSKKEVESTALIQKTEKEESEGTAEKKVNINTATKEELMTLNGIGEAKAEAIIRYRDQEGGFQSIEDIKKIEGIKEGVFHKVKDRITI